MNIRDYSKEFPPDTAPSGRHSGFFPKNIMCVIAGSTGSGKTNLICNLLKEPGILNYSDVFVYSPTLYQPAYKFLRSYYTNLEELLKQKCGRTAKIAHFYDTDAEIVDPSTLRIDRNHVMIFDDVMLDDQTLIKQYFCRGRHNNVSVFYLCQSLHKIKKHCIRDNANTFILFKQDDKTMKYFFETHISGDMDFKEFKTFYDGVWCKKFSFIVINLWEEAEYGRYLDSYATVFTPKKYFTTSNKMPIQPISDIKEYVRQRDAIQARNRAERTGQQVLFEAQSKLLKPVTDVQRETAKNIIGKIASKDDVLIPFTKELQRRNDQLEALSQQPFYNQDIPAPPPAISGTIPIDLDQNLDDTDRDNLVEMELALPSEVFEKGDVEETLEKIKSNNRRIGQILGTGPAGRKAPAQEKKWAESRRQTLKLYKEKIEGIMKSSQFMVTSKKGKGFTDVVVYKSPTDLKEKLGLQVAAKKAGNNGVDNIIHSILDELLRIDEITKDEYDVLYRGIFKSRKDEKGLCNTCNCLVRYDDKAKHKRTKKHQKNLRNLKKS